jgi:hypothetical protein
MHITYGRSFQFVSYHTLLCTRAISEIEESENRARKQAEYLRKCLEEHNLELRVKAANEAETACQQRLSIAEAELEDLRAKVDASERLVLVKILFSQPLRAKLFSSLLGLAFSK